MYVYVRHLAQTLASQSIDVAAAAKLRSSFLNTFPGIQAFIDRCVMQSLIRSLITSHMTRRPGSCTQGCKYGCCFVMSPPPPTAAPHSFTHTHTHMHIPIVTGCS